MPQDFWGNAIFSVVPTIVITLIFFFLLRNIVRGDRVARREWNKIMAEERAKAGLPPESPRPAVPSAPVNAETAEHEADAQATEQAARPSEHPEP